MSSCLCAFPSAWFAAHSGGGSGGELRGPDPARRDDEVVVRAHAPGGFDDLGLVVANDLDALQLDAEVEAVAGEERRVSVDSLPLEVSPAAR